MLCAVSMDKYSVMLYDTESLKLKTLSLSDALKELARTAFKGVLGLKLFDESQRDIVTREEYTDVLGMVTPEYEHSVAEDAGRVWLKCDNIRPYYDKDVLSFNRDKFKLYFKSGVVLLLWCDGYMYKLEEKQGSIYLNGAKTSWGYMPPGISYVVDEHETAGYTLYLKRRWLNIEGRYLRHCYNHEVHYGREASVTEFKNEVKKYMHK